MYNIKKYDDFLNEEYKDLDVLNNYSIIAINTLKDWTNNTLKDFKRYTFKEKYDLINDNIISFLDSLSNINNDKMILIEQKNILVSIIVNKIMRYENEKNDLKKLKRINKYSEN